MPEETRLPPETPLHKGQGAAPLPVHRHHHPAEVGDGEESLPSPQLVQTLPLKRQLGARELDTRGSH